MSSAVQRINRITRALAVLSIPVALSFTPGFAPSAAARVLTQDGTPRVIRAKSVPRKLDLCTGYMSRTNYAGEPYRIVEKDRIVTRHEGMDFCARAGTPVISPVAGTIVWVVDNNPLRSGQVLIKSGFRVALKPGDTSAQPVYFGIVHMRPAAGLARGKHVAAGQVIGVVQAAGLPEIGSRAHLHFTARICESHKCHIDPNFFWLKGVGKVSCFGGEAKLPKGKIVAPLAC